MADVFLSYDRADSEPAERLAGVLNNMGWSVWWDRELQPRADQTFSKVIQDEISHAGALLVLWSERANQSDWVRAEAAEGLKSRKLIQASLDGATPPLPFSAYHFASLAEWNGLADHGTFTGVAAAIEHFIPRTALSHGEAESLIRAFGNARHTRFGATDVSCLDSPFGTAAYRARASDGMGLAYCHATGKLRGQVFYVRKGIALLYEDHVGGAVSPLGLPISNEEIIDGKGYPTSFFEGGYIEWSPKTWLAKAFRYADGGAVVIAEATV